MKKHFVAGLLVLALVLPIAVRAQNVNPDELAASLLRQVEELRQQINQLQAQLSKLEQAVQEVVKFTKTLRKGTQDKEEVEKLQEFLKQDPEVYPEGLVTGYYGPLTEKAVRKFQEKHAEDVLKPLGLSEGTGVVGEKTIGKMNKVLEEASKSGTVPQSLLQREEKITICHIPSGSPANRNTITISKSALEAHLAQGDIMGACPQTTEPVACTADVKLCPDSSYVSRQLPKCEFASCPSQPAASVITLLSPNGGEWKIGHTYEISWKQTQDSAIAIALQNKQLVEGYSPWYKTTITNLSGKTGKNDYSWTVPAGLNPHTGYEVCVSNSVSEDCSEPSFYISSGQTTTQYSLAVISPNGGETWTTGSLQYVRWSSNIPATHKIVAVRLRDSAGAEHSLLSDTPNDGAEKIAVPTTLLAGAYLLEIKTAFENQTVFDQSDATFNVVAAEVPTPTPIPTPILYLPDIEPFNLMTGHVYANESNTIGANLNNVGTTVLSQNFVIKYYVDGNYVGERESQAVLAPTTSGGSNTSVGSISYTFADPGNHEVKAVLDANDAVSEIYETNNTISRTVNIVTPSQTLADLEVFSLYPSHHYANQANNIYVRLINRGAVVIPKDFVIKFYIDGNYVGERAGKDLLPGDGTTTSIPCVFSGSGTHEVKIMVDAANSVVESSDGNNILIQTITMR